MQIRKGIWEREGKENKSREEGEKQGKEKSVMEVEREAKLKQRRKTGGGVRV